MKEKLAINFGKYIFGPKTPFHWKRCFSWRLGPFVGCFEWKYHAVSENVFSMSVIYLHFFHCKFSLFLWIYWVRFKTWLAKGPILELAAWTAKSAKSESLIYGNFRSFLWTQIQIWGHFFPLLFPKDSKNLKNLDIWLQEVGSKRHLNGTSQKCR